MLMKNKYKDEEDYDDGDEDDEGGDHVMMTIMAVVRISIVTPVEGRGFACQCRGLQLSGDHAGDADEKRDAGRRG